MNFLAELYQSDNFTLYLTIALVVLVVLFVIVLLFGKRDQKLEETKRLQKIELDNFKEEKTEPTKLEVKKESTPSIEDAPNLNTEVSSSPVVETKEETAKPSVEEEVNVTIFEPSISQDIEVEDTPTISIEEMSPKKEETKPLFVDSNNNQPIAINELSEMNFEEVDLEKDLTELENIKTAFDEIELPKIDEEPKKEVTKPSPQIFSSVFVSNSEAPLRNEEEKITIVDKEPEIPSNKLFTIEEDEEEFELPSLKNATPETDTPIVKEKEEVMPLINDDTKKAFSFDDVAGETYNLK